MLRTMPELADAHVLGVPSALRGEQLVAVVVPRDSAPGTAALRAYCAARLAPYKVPRAFVVALAIPRDVRGKTDRQALTTLVAAHLSAAGDAGSHVAGAILHRQSDAAECEAHNEEERG